MNATANESMPRVLSAARCEDCVHRDPDRGVIERAVSGLTVFGSGYGSSVADTRLCTLRDRFVSPDDGCASFEASC